MGRDWLQSRCSWGWGLAVDSHQAGIPDERGNKERTSRLIPPICHLRIDEYAESPIVGDTQVRNSIVDREVAFDLDDTISIEDAAAALHVRRQWLVRRSQRYPFY